MKLSLSQNIAKLRKAHGITQEQVAEALGVSCAAVSKWERGVATPELSLIAEMANLFDVSVDVLIGYEFHGNGRNAATARQVSASILGLDGTTRIVVTHTLDAALLRQYDCILALKNGRIQESGTFEELMDQKEYFYSLFTVSQ